MAKGRSDRSKLLLKNCALYGRWNSDHLVDVGISGGKITRVGTDLPKESAHTVDVAGRVIAPGLIDVHIQGAGGADVLDGTEDALRTISKKLARLGTTGFLTTTVVRKKDNGHLATARGCVGKELGGARLLGIHLEGPFINPVKRGGISRDCISPPSLKRLDEILELTGPALRMMTIAPELEESREVISELTNRGIIASLGHTNATYDETVRGFQAGISHVTHLFNAMPSLHHRNPGPVLAVFQNMEVSAQIISDGIHLDRETVRFIYDLLGDDRCICVTDGVQATGLPEGEYIYNEREYESRGGVGRYTDGTLIGTTMGLWEIARRFKEFTGCSLESAVHTVTKNPARLLGLDDSMGTIEKGKKADLVLLDEDHSVWMTIVDGNVLYRREPQTDIPKRGRLA